ncbi:hypothetical protein ACO0SA_000831 [Hanseniaspora valbyensis]
MVVVNPKNWHWVERNTVGWTNEYFKTQFIPLSYNNEKYVIELVSVDDIKGDSNVSQRKGKVICYFDLQLNFFAKITSKDNNDETIQFKVNIPEFMHDENDFLIEFLDLDKDGECYEVVVNEFKPVFLEKILNYQQDLINFHSKDVQE